MKKNSITCIHKTHTMYQIQNLTKQSPVYVFRHIFQSSPKWTNLSNLGGSVGRSESGVVVGAEFSLSISSSTFIGLAVGSLLLKIVKDGCGKWGIKSMSINTVHIHSRTFPTEFNVL